MKKTPTLTRASVRFVHADISSLVDISGYRLRAKWASSSCSCWLVKCVLCLRWRGFLLESLSAEGSSVLLFWDSSTAVSPVCEKKEEETSGKQRRYWGLRMINTVWGQRQRVIQAMVIFQTGWNLHGDLPMFGQYELWVLPNTSPV